MDRFKDVEKIIDDTYKKDIKDPWKLNYHFESLFGLINDPNGLSYFNDEYYIFYQWNPLGVVHKNKCWGLTRTRDFINYTVPQLVLRPEDYFDKDGVYSGSAIEANGILNIIYTGNVKDENNNRTPYQCLAYLGKDGEIKKCGPVVSNVPDGYTAHFRDPKVFIKDGAYYFVIGAQNNELKGRALLYKSNDLKKWSFIGEIDTEYKDFGFMWECPNLLQIEGKDILIFSPQGLESEEYKYQNIYQSGYIVGDMNYDNLLFKHNEFLELDFGTDFYAPQVFEDNKGRQIMIGWMGLPEEEDNHPTAKNGRVHCLTMPRELFLKDGYIYQKPIEELKNLRVSSIDAVSNIRTSRWENHNITQNSYEVNMALNMKDAKDITIKLASSKDECIKLIFSLQNNEIIYKNELKQGMQSVRKIKCNDINSEIELRIFMDKSALEIYINEGRYVLSNRIYPQENSTGLEIYSDNEDFVIDYMRIWSLGGFNYDK